MNNANLYEAAETTVADERVLDVSSLLGEWSNTNDAATGISRLLMIQTGNGVVVRVFGAGHPEPFDWGEAPVELFVELPESKQATSFTSFYDLGFMSVWLLVYLNKGVLVVISLTQFQDGSGRSNYWAREFFYSREPAGVR
jgi:hypothetical protein